MATAVVGAAIVGFGNYGHVASLSSDIFWQLLDVVFTDCNNVHHNSILYMTASPDQIADCPI